MYTAKERINVKEEVERQKFQAISLVGVSTKNFPSLKYLP